LYYSNAPLAVRLLQEGAVIDDQCLSCLEELLRSGLHQILSTVIHHVERHNVHDTDVPRLLRLQIAVGKDPISSRDGENGPLQPIDCGPSLRAAAEFGQVDVITQLLRRETIDVDAADKADGITALHFAARNDHHEIVKLLHAHGAQSKMTDCDGRAAIHHAIRGNSYSCLEFFLKEASDDIPHDKDGNSLWHLASRERDKQTLEILARFLTPIPRLSSLKAKDGWSPLLCAASVGSVECLEWLLQAGCDVMDVANDGSTALHLAVESRSLKATRLLLAKGCDVNSRGRIGETSLMIAAQRGYVGIMGLLISNGADLEAVDENGWNIVHFACDTGQLRTLQFLRHTNVDWNKRAKCIIFSGRSTECSPLHLAAKNQKTEILEYLLEEGLVTDINVLTDDSVTALYIATIYNLPSAVSALLSRNADPNIRCAPGGLLPVQCAAQEGKLAVIAVFLRYNCDLGVQDGVDCEILAMLSGHKAAAKLFKEHKVEQASRSRQLSKALKVAIDRADIGRCKKIVENGASLNLGFSECQGCRPLLYALQNVPRSRVRYEIVEFLAMRGASIEGLSCGLSAPKELELSAVSQLKWFQRSIHDLVGLPVGEMSPQYPWYTNDDISRFLYAMTPLHIAASKGHLRIARFLLEHGANTNAIDGISGTPLHHAAATNDTAMIELLLQFGSNVHAVDSCLTTACMVAAKFNEVGPLQIMTAKGANLQAQDVYGTTALYYAAHNNSLSAISVLSTRGHELDLGCHGSKCFSPASLICFAGRWHELQLILNLATNPKIYTDPDTNCLTALVQNLHMTTSLLRKFLKRLSQPIVAALLPQRAKIGGTPLYATCTLTHPHKQADFATMLLEAGADLEHEGGVHGTPLMGACATGRLTAVKFLVSRGAKIAYTNDDGITISALKAARHFPEIVRWLLVERYTQGPKRILG
ncbi:MAG: hypothetical protein LQ348_005686, partial [Seirophora lacunosa]